MRTKIERKLKKKTNKELVETIIKAKKKSNWLKVADKISTTKINQKSLNLDEIDKKASENDVIVIPGKVLGTGKVSKKIKIVALNFSESAKDKLTKDKIEFSTIDKEIKENPEAKKIKLLQ